MQPLVYFTLCYQFLHIPVFIILHAIKIVLIIHWLRIIVEVPLKFTLLKPLQRVTLLIHHWFSPHDRDHTLGEWSQSYSAQSRLSMMINYCYLFIKENYNSANMQKKNTGFKATKPCWMRQTGIINIELIEGILYCIRKSLQNSSNMWFGPWTLQCLLVHREASIICSELFAEMQNQVKIFVAIHFSCYIYLHTYTCSAGG